MSTALSEFPPSAPEQDHPASQQGELRRAVEVLGSSRLQKGQLNS